MNNPLNKSCYMIIKNKCRMVLRSLQKQHTSRHSSNFTLGDCLLSKSPSLSRNQINILTLRCIFNFHSALFKGVAIWFIILLYIDCKAKNPLIVRAHLMESCWSSSYINDTFATKSFCLLADLVQVDLFMISCHQIRPK